MRPFRPWEPCYAAVSAHPRSTAALPKGPKEAPDIKGNMFIIKGNRFIICVENVILECVYCIRVSQPTTSPWQNEVLWYTIINKGIINRSNTHCHTHTVIVVSTPFQHHTYQWHRPPPLIKRYAPTLQNAGESLQGYHTLGGHRAPR